MKNDVFLASLAFLLLGNWSLHSSPLITVSDHSAIYFNGSASVTSDSNILFDETNEIDDIVIQVRPGFEWVYGNAVSGVQLIVLADYALRRYADNDRFDADYPSIRMTGEFLSPKSRSTLNASYIETQANSRFSGPAGTLLETKISSAGIKTDYRATAKSAVAAGVSFVDEDKKTAGSDYSTLVVPLNVYYAATEKLDVGIGYRYRSSSVDRDVVISLGDRTSHFINLAFRGELTPKLVADLKLGYQVTDVKGSNDFSGLSVDALFSYAPNEKSSMSLTLSKDYLVGFQGEVIDNLSASLLFDYSFDPQLVGSVMLMFANDEFKNNPREQDFSYVKFGLTYRPSQFVSITGDYIFQKNDANIPGLSFDGNIFSLSVGVRY
jgi:hypothetical protein